MMFSYWYHCLCYRKCCFRRYWTLLRRVGIGYTYEPVVGFGIHAGAGLGGLGIEAFDGNLNGCLEDTVKSVWLEPSKVPMLPI